MIVLSDTVKDIIESGYMSFFYLVNINHERFYTTAPYNIVMDNGNTFYSDGGLIGVEPPRISSVVDRASYKIQVADVDFSLKSYFEQGAVGDRITVRVGFFNTLGVTRDGIAPGDAFTQLANTIIMYRGAIDAQAYEIDMAQNTAVASIEGSSPMADLDLVKVFVTNRENMRRKNPWDSAFDKVFEGSGEITLQWGK